MVFRIRAYPFLSEPRSKNINYEVSHSVNLTDGKMDLGIDLFFSLENYVELSD